MREENYGASGCSASCAYLQISLNDSGDPNNPVWSGWPGNDARVDSKSIVNVDACGLDRSREAIPCNRRDAKPRRWRTEDVQGQGQELGLCILRPVDRVYLQAPRICTLRGFESRPLPAQSGTPYPLTLDIMSQWN